MEQSNDFLYISKNSIIVIDKILNIIKCVKINTLNIYLMGKEYPVILECNTEEDTNRIYNELITKITNLKKLQYGQGKR